MIGSTSNIEEKLLVRCRPTLSSLHEKHENSFKCLEHHQVSDKVRLLHIFKGYREENQSISYYVKSVFRQHNETANVWSHFLPLMFFVYRYAAWMQTLETPWDPLHYPYYVNGAGICFLLLVSTVAHTFCTRSSFAAEFCFGVDFAAIQVYGISCMVALESYLCPINCYAKGPKTSTYFVFVVVYSTAANSLALYVNTVHRKFVPIVRAMVCTTGMVIVQAPCFFRYTHAFEPSPPDNPMSQVGKTLSIYYFAQVVCVLIAAGFYGTRFPESKFPRLFDTLGCSHNWFHLFTSLMMYFQAELIFHALLEIKDGIEKQILSADDFITTSWIGVVNIFIISMFSLMLSVIVYFYGTNITKKHKLH